MFEFAPHFSPSVIESKGTRSESKGMSGSQITDQAQREKLSWVEGINLSQILRLVKKILIKEFPLLM